MSGYTKLFGSILASTIWRSSDKTRLVWITMMAMADRNGNVEASIPGLADLARVSIPDCQCALAELAAPDEFSRSRERDGRRIEDIDGGWHLINHDKYRKKMGADERREYLKLKQREYRAAKRQKASTSVNNVSDTDTELTHTEAEAEAEAEASPKAERSLNRNTKLVRDGVAANKAAVGNNGNGRSRHPVFKGQRFVVFDWQLEDLERLLGPHYENFDLHSWFFDLDASVVKAAAVVPQRDGGKWLQEKCLEEARLRNLPIGTSQVVSDIGRQNLINAQGAIARIKAGRSAHD